MNQYIPWIHDPKIKKQDEPLPLYKELENPSFYIPKEKEKEEENIIIIEL
jgi:hypothetical protein